MVATFEKLERPGTTTRSAHMPATMRERLVTTFQRTRAETERIAAPLSPEDQQLQGRPEASPTKWHRAHTTWFWEQFLLAPFGIAPVDERWVSLFNSYYESVTQRHGAPAARAMRGMLSRPSCEAVAQYRRVVDDRVVGLLSRLDEAALEQARTVVELGVAHEEQHQELILTDILAAFAESPLRPVYVPAQPTIALRIAPQQTERTLYEGGLVEVGARGAGFAFDCERPRHRVWLEAFALANAPIRVGEVKAFIEERGYQTPSLWLADGWAWARAHDVRAPGYARMDGGALVVFTLHGERVAEDDEPASHLSYFEADAIARFLGGRLPTEHEHEHATSQTCALRGFRDDGSLVPGRVWEWTSSSFAAYPGYVATDGASAGNGWGEYNGKFMHGQMVLRGGSCLTNRAHMRPSLRNFWPSSTRFQMTGARVAYDVRADGSAGESADEVGRRRGGTT